MNIRFVKLLDSFLGQLLVLLLPSAKKKKRPSIKNLLLIRPGGIGDAVHLIPAINAIKSAFPDAHITVLAEKRNYSVFSLAPAVNKVLLYDRPIELFSALNGKYDAVVDTEQWHRLSAVIARLTRSSISIGYATSERARMFNQKITYSHDDDEITSFLHLVAPLGIQPEVVQKKFLQVPEDAIDSAKYHLEQLEQSPFVVIFPGASIAERQWGADRFSTLSSYLTQLGLGVVIVGAAGDHFQAEKISKRSGGLNLAGKTTLTETAAIIDQCALLVSGDSGVLHIAVGLEKPTVSLFGPGRSQKWAPRGDRHIVLNKDLPCSPCTTFGNTPPCPIGAKCMRDITVDDVFNAVTTLLRAEGVIPSLCCKGDWLEIRRKEP